MEMQLASTTLGVAFVVSLLIRAVLMLTAARLTRLGMTFGQALLAQLVGLGTSLAGALLLAVFAVGTAALSPQLLLGAMVAPALAVAVLSLVSMALTVYRLSGCQDLSDFFLFVVVWGVLSLLAAWGGLIPRVLQLLRVA
jgi:hypothetical protein